VAAVAERGALGAPADVIESRIGELDGVEVVHGHGDVGEDGRDASQVAGVGVDGDL
jgi:hypothetical protein